MKNIHQVHLFGRGSSGTRQLEDLLSALARTVDEIGALGEKTQIGIAHHTFSPYHEYRARIDAFKALATTIGGRIERLPSKSRDLYPSRLRDQERRLMAVTIRSSFNFFFALSTIPNLPVGIRELFKSELKAMQQAKEALRMPEHVGKLPQGLDQDLETAEAILNEVMEKAPSLLVSFDDTPSGLVVKRSTTASITT